MKALNKSIFTQISSELADSDELELINRHTIKPLTADEVFCFTVTLCDNEVDRDSERFSISALQSLAEMFVGKTGIIDHSMRSGDQTSRIYKTWLEESDTQKTSIGENYTCLKAKAYMPVTRKNADLITEIEAGIKKEASIGCAVGSVLCSVCGADMRTGSCKHRKGEAYNGKVCHAVLDKPTDAYEFSFVAVPAQPRAGVTKSFNAPDSLSLVEIKEQAADYDSVTLSLGAFEKLTGEMHRLEVLARDADAYRSYLEQRVKYLAALAVPALAGGGFADICKTLTAAQLAELERAFETGAAKNYPVRPQLCGETSKTENNDEFRI